MHGDLRRTRLTSLGGTWGELGPMALPPSSFLFLLPLLLGAPLFNTVGAPTRQPLEPFFTLFNLQIRHRQTSQFSVAVPNPRSLLATPLGSPR